MWISDLSWVSWNVSFYLLEVIVYSQRANPGDVLLTFINQLNYFYQCIYCMIKISRYSFLWPQHAAVHTYFFYLIIFSQSGHFFLTFACIILILFHSSKVNRTIRYSLILNISKHNFAKRSSDDFWPGNWMDSDLEILIFLLTVFFKKCVLSCHIFQKLKTEKLRFECQQCQECN